MLQSLQLSGIRSYSPGEDSTIDFDEKLTIIHGHNGSGKTTIIEALKVVTTGAYPPNSDNGRTFVTDPKFAGAPEVHAAVRIRFKTHRGKVVKAARLIEVTRRSAKLTIKSSECQVAVMDEKGKFETKTLTVSTYDKFIPELLGVSSAVLQNVTFCHQDKTLWPFSDSSELKTIFDEIFSTEHFSKAEETHRKFIKAKDQVMGDKRKELEFLLEKERLYKEKQNEFRDIETQIREITEVTEELQYQFRTVSETEDRYRLLAGRYKDFTEKKHVFLNLQTIIKQLKDQLPICSFSTGPSLDALKTAEATVKSSTQVLSQFTQKQRNLSDEILRTQEHLSNIRENLMESKENGEEKRGKIKFFAERLFIDSRILQEDEQAFIEIEASKIDTLNREILEEKTALQQAKTHYNEAYGAFTYVQVSLSNAQKRLLDMKTAFTQAQKANENGQKLGLQAARAEKDFEKTKHLIEKSDLEIVDLQRELLEITKSLEEIEEKGKEARDTVEKNRIWEGICSVFREFPGLKPYENAPFKEIQGLLRTDWEGKVRESAILQSQESRTRLELKDLEACLRSLQVEISTNKQEMETTETDLNNSLGLSSWEELTQRTHEDWVSDLKKKTESIELKTADLNARERVYEELRDRSCGNEECGLCRKKMTKMEITAMRRNLEDVINEYKGEIHQQTEEKEETELQLSMLAGNQQNLNKFCTLKSREIELDSALNSKNASYLQHLNSITDLSAQIHRQSAVSIEVKTALNHWETRVLKEMNPSIEVLSISFVSAVGFLGKNDKSGEEIIQRIEEMSEKQGVLEARILSAGKRRETLHLEALKLEREMHQIQTQQIALGDFNSLHLETDIKALEQEIPALKAQETTLETEKEKTHLSVIEAEKRLNSSVQKQAETVRIVGNLKELLGSYRNDVRKCKEMKDQLSGNEEKLAKLGKENETLKAKIIDLEAERTKAQAIITANSVLLQYHKQMELLQKKTAELAQVSAELESIKPEIAGFSPDLHAKNTAEMHRLQVQISELLGKMTILKESRKKLEGYAGGMADGEQSTKMTEEIAVIGQLIEEHKLFLRLLDTAILSYHSMKIDQVNALLREFWRLTYRGRDIETIELRAEPDQTKKVKSYNYRLVLHGLESDMDMRGRCSAGQKILASIVLRLALAKAFSGVCGIVALDEPTTNLDRDNATGLAEALSNFVQSQPGIQLIVITHDQDFVDVLQRHSQRATFYQVEKRRNMSHLSIRANS